MRQGNGVLDRRPRPNGVRATSQGREYIEDPPTSRPRADTEALRLPVGGVDCRLQAPRLVASPVPSLSERKVKKATGLTLIECHVTPKVRAEPPRPTPHEVPRGWVDFGPATSVVVGITAGVDHAESVDRARLGLPFQSASKRSINPRALMGAGGSSQALSESLVNPRSSRCRAMLPATPAGRKRTWPWCSTRRSIWGGSSETCSPAIPSKSTAPDSRTTNAGRGRVHQGSRSLPQRCHLRQLQ